jgi:hypothetical protein
MTDSIKKLWCITPKFENAAKKFLIETAKEGLAGSILGYCVCQLSGANPLTYSLAYHSARIAKLTDALICKTMLAYGPPTATKKAISFKLSLATGFLFFYQALSILGYQSLRDDIINRIVQNGFAYQTYGLITGCTLLLVASDHMGNQPVMKKVNEAAILAMQLRANEISWDNSDDTSYNILSRIDSTVKPNASARSRAGADAP